VDIYTQEHIQKSVSSSFAGVLAPMAEYFFESSAIANRLYCLFQKEPFLYPNSNLEHLCKHLEHMCKRSLLPCPIFAAK
jgi:hypothetical protein